MTTESKIEWPDPAPKNVGNIQRQTVTGKPTQTGKSAQKSPSPNNPYKVSDGQICAVRFEKNGAEALEPLCNFQARAMEEIIKDDGQDITRHIAVVGKLDNGRELPRVLVPMSEFLNMRWIAKHWGFGPVVRAGHSKQDKLREAIQTLSGVIPERRIHVHTGWKCVDGQFIYIHSQGCIGNAQVDVQLDQGLESYALPKNFSLSESQEGAKRALEILHIADPSITFPLFAAVHLAPFSSMCRPDFMLWLLGTTGSLKSTLATLFLNFFGNFERTGLPANWESTENSLERKCFVLKDSLVVIDDFAPATSSEADREKERKAQRIIRAIGNRAGRERMRSDLTMRPAFNPRCLVISTGEQLPSGQSIMARLFVIPIDKNKIRLDLLSEAQEHKYALSVYMADFLGMCSSNPLTVVTSLQSKFKETRQLFKAPHLRVPEMTAWLQVGFNLGMASLSRFFPPDILDPLLKQSKNVFLHLAEQQSRTIQEERPSIRFLSVLWTLLSQGRLNLNEIKGRDRCVGWTNSDFIFLRPSGAYNAIAKFCRDEGTHFGIKPHSLHKGIYEDGFSIISEEGRYTIRETNPSSVQERILKLKRNKVEELIGKMPD